MYVYICVYVCMYMVKKQHIIYLKVQIFLFFSLIKLLKRREIFLLLNKLCGFFTIYFSDTLKVGIYLYIYMYIYIYIYMYVYIYI